MKNWGHLIKKYHHAIPLIIYGIIYFSWFSHLEQTVTKNYRIIHMNIDDHIPFVEIFVIPYFLWFAYVAVVIMFFFFQNKDDYYRTCIFLFTGMTIFLIISTLWPNGHHLRPFIMPRANIFTRMIAVLYKTDTATNLWPSIHVYNSIGAHLAIAKSNYFKNKPVVRACSFVLAASIVLSTVFIKQHSMFDVLTAFALAAIMYVVVYRCDLLIALRHKLNNNRKKTRPETI